MSSRMARQQLRRRYGRWWKVCASAVTLLLAPLAMAWYRFTGAGLSLQVRTFRVELRKRSGGSTKHNFGLIYGTDTSTQIRQPNLVRPNVYSLDQDIESWFGEPGRIEGKWIDFGKAGRLVSTRVYAGDRLLQNHVNGRLFTPWPEHVNERALMDGSVERRLRKVSIEVSRCLPSLTQHP
jgi:hypothetical protein